MAVLPLSAPPRRPARRPVGPAPGRLTHRVPALCTVLLGVLLALIVPATAAYAGPDEGTFTAGANGARAGSGLPAYRVAADLVAVARGQAQRMAGAGRLYHNPNLASEVRGWSFVGENVGVGPSAQAIQNAFMASPSHRSNILDRDFTEIGVGTAVGADGRLWVSEVFRRPAGATAAAAPQPAPPRPAAAGPAAARPAAAPPTHVPPPAPPSPPPSPTPPLPERVAVARATAGAPAPDPVGEALRFAEVLRVLAGPTPPG